MGPGVQCSNVSIRINATVDQFKLGDQGAGSRRRVGKRNGASRQLVDRVDIGISPRDEVRAVKWGAMNELSYNSLDVVTVICYDVCTRAKVSHINVPETHGGNDCSIVGVGTYRYRTLQFGFKMCGEALEAFLRLAFSESRNDTNGQLILGGEAGERRSEEHTSELQSRGHLVCRLL